MHDLVIKNGRVFTAESEFVGDVAVQGERIAALGRGLSGRRVLDARGLYVLPGAVDGHVHMHLATSYGHTADGFYEGTRAAAYGGVTTIIDFVDPRPDQSLLEALAARRAQADGQVVVDYALHMTLTGALLAARPSWREDVYALRDQGCTSFKLYTAYPNYYLPDDALLDALDAVAAVDGLAVVHAENWPVIQVVTRRLLAEGRVEPRWHPHSRPAVTEGEAVNRVLALARLAGTRVLIFHMSCRDALQALARAKAAGQAAYGETCPQYLVLDDACYARPLPDALRCICQPPIRERAEQDGLWQGLVDGTLDIVSTDHCPHPDLEKQKGAANFSLTAGGISGVETRLALLYTFGVASGRLTPQRWVDVCCTRPAVLHGLPNKGRLLPGADADIVLFDPQRAVTLSALFLHSAIDYSQYEGLELRGWPVTTIARGEVIVEDGQLHALPGRGRFLDHRG